MKVIHSLLLSLLLISVIAEDCSNLNGEYGCNGDQREYPSDWDERSFQTPPRDDTLGNYRETYQDIHNFYIHLIKKFVLLISLLE